MKRLYVIITSFRFLLHWIFYQNAKNRAIIEEDLKRNIHQFLHKEKVSFFNFCEILTFYTMVRNIFYARVAFNHHYYAKFISIFARPLPLLDISSTAEIGGGLIVQHGYATIIAPKKIGKNCWVNQGVTIGYTNDHDCPTIGNNVTIYCGAKVLGNVTIGNNVIIAANAVVVKDVEDNCVVAGVPAKVIKNYNTKDL